MKETPIVVVKLVDGKLPVIERNDTFQAVINRVVKTSSDFAVFSKDTEVDNSDIFISAWINRKSYGDIFPETGVSIFKVVGHSCLSESYRAFVPYNDNVAQMVKMMPHEAVREFPKIKQLIAGITAELRWFADNTEVITISDPEIELYNHK